MLAWEEDTFLPTFKQLAAICSEQRQHYYGHYRKQGFAPLISLPPETWARLLCCDFCFYNFFKQAGIPALFLYIPVIPLYIPVILAKPNWAADSVSSNGPPVQNQSSSRVTKVKRAIDHPSSK